MQPRRRLARRIPMVRTLRLALAASLVLVLVGCGGEDGAGDETASDPGSQEPTTGATTETTPTAPPTVGSYPDFGPRDYTFLLTFSCFCPDSGTPIRVTVVGGEVTEAVYAGGGRGVTEGDPAPRSRRLSLNEVISAANDVEAERVDVVWPAGQDYPTSVTVDTSTRMADEEIGYTVSDVVVG